LVAAFGERFPKAQLHLPLTTLEGMKNRPEVAVSLGTRLPAHRLRLDNGKFGAALFTSLPACRECAGKLSWETDGKPIKTLVLPGAAALAYLQELMISPDADRAIVNPMSASELHLARTDVDAMAAGSPLRSLWFYARDGSMKVPVEIAGSSLLSAVLEMADRAFSKKNEVLVETGPPPDPLPALTSELLELLAREGAPDMDITIAKSRGEVRVEALPKPGAELLARIQTLAENHLAELSGSTQVTLRIEGSAKPAPSPAKARKAPPTRRARHRLPWLLVGLAGSMFAALVVSRFESVLESHLAIAFFVSSIVYLADAIGTQTEAIVVRGLSVSRLSLRHLLAGELRTGLLIGAMLAGLSLPVVALAFGDARLGLSVAAAILVAGGVATTIGLLLPWLLQRLGSDPAFGSGPVATIIQDVLSLLIYLAIATLVMR
jgi:hypothetical protein